MTKVKGRLGEWIEAKMRALSAPAIPATVLVAPVDRAPDHVWVAERGARAVDTHGRTRRAPDARGHRSSRGR